MKIGTPLSSNATKVMLLGAGELGKEVIIALQRLGVEVIAVDRYANAPGHPVAHRAHVIDMADGKALRALIEKEKPQLVVPEIEAIATEMLARIEADGLAEVIPTARAAQLTMNREGIRRLAAEELSLPTSRYAFAESASEVRFAAESLGYPCIVKPVMSSSGKGQYLEHAGRYRQSLGLRDDLWPGESRARDRRRNDPFRLRNHLAYRAFNWRKRKSQNLVLRTHRARASEG